MNKQKRALIRLQANRFQRLVNNIEPFPQDIKKELLAIYMPICSTVIHANIGLLKSLPCSKKARLLRVIITDESQPIALWGNIYTTKMLMLSAINKKWFDHYKNNFSKETLVGISFFHK